VRPRDRAEPATERLSVPEWSAVADTIAATLRRHRAAAAARAARAAAAAAESAVGGRPAATRRGGEAWDATAGPTAAWGAWSAFLAARLRRGGRRLTDAAAAERGGRFLLELVRPSARETVRIEVLA
jgi:hypothetical protein